MKKVSAKSATRKISATQLRSTLFKTLDDLERGATVLIEREGKVVARLVPATQNDWRAGIIENPVALVAEEEVFAPIEEIFE